MWFTQLVKDAANGVSATAKAIYDVVTELPTAAKHAYDRIRLSDLMSELYRRSIRINGGYAISALALKWIAKPLAVKSLASYFELTEDAEDNLNSFFDYIIITPALFRLYLSMRLRDTTNTLLGIVQMNAEVTRDTPVDVTYEIRKAEEQEDESRRATVLGNVSIGLHYLVNLITIKGLNFVLKGMPLGEFAAIGLTAYSTTVIAGEYALDSLDVVPSDQIRLLTSPENRIKCLVIGLSYQLLLITNEAYLPAEIATAINNIAVLMLVNIIQEIRFDTSRPKVSATEVDDFVKIDDETKEFTFDPLRLTWRGTHQVTNRIYAKRKVIEARIKAMLADDGPPSPIVSFFQQRFNPLVVEYFSWLYAKYQKQSVTQILLVLTANTMKVLFIPSELRSLENFVNDDIMQPYVVILAKKGQQAADLLKLTTSHVGFTVAQLTLRAPVLGSVVIFAGKKACGFYDIPKGVFKLLVKLITEFDSESLNRHLERLVKQLVSLLDEKGQVALGIELFEEWKLVKLPSEEVDTSPQENPFCYDATTTVARSAAATATQPPIGTVSTVTDEHDGTGEIDDWELVGGEPVNKDDDGAENNPFTDEYERAQAARAVLKAAGTGVDHSATSSARLFKRRVRQPERSGGELIGAGASAVVILRK